MEGSMVGRSIYAQSVVCYYSSVMLFVLVCPMHQYAMTHVWEILCNLAVYVLSYLPVVDNDWQLNHLCMAGTFDSKLLSLFQLLCS